MYTLLRNFLFLFGPEQAHHISMKLLKLGCSFPIIRQMIARQFTPADKPVTAFGIRFRNQIGLGAGFDKNAKYLRELEALGFGCVEIGTVTPKAQDGNERPRLFRLPADKALINRMGFNNEGVEAVAKRLRKWREKKHVLVIGGNIGKNKVTPNNDAWMDYEICFNELHPYVDYFVVNVSSPNTPGLRELQEKESLRKILTNLQCLNDEKTVKKPILLKIAPDLTREQLDDVVNLALEIELDGIVATNTTISRAGLRTPSVEVEKMGAGGLSGAPVRSRSTEVVEYLFRKSNGKLPIIASGGIFVAADAREKLRAGASLIQVWTGFIYEGPGILKNICRGQ
ncbi:MAG: quinone-dependent dihydroorotate dehydrogenase [Chitinophagaceae bacterium]|nr:quinone-dependent dihydroorotate dehydrogenase [Chitinophagaceae bacterium]